MFQLRQFLRDYIDRLRSERSRNVRERFIIDNNYSENEQSAPFLAPNWTRSGYNGKLKSAVMQACNTDHALGHTSTDTIISTDNSADTTAMNNLPVPDQPPVSDQPDNSADATATVNDGTSCLDNMNNQDDSVVTDVASQDSDALYSLRYIYSEEYDADGEGGEEEVVEETVLLTSTQQDDQNPS
jgi:hypothetical protein